MSDSDLGKALLQLDAAQLAGVPDARQQTWRILEHDRRRVRRLTVLAVVLWVFAALLVLLVFVAFGLLFPFMAKVIRQVEDAREDAAGVQMKSQVGQVFRVIQAGQAVAFIAAGALGVLGLAALATVFLVLASRRATLRQVNASLLEISEQLRQLRAPPAAGT
jgi:hypothetical protein